MTFKDKNAHDAASQFLVSSWLARRGSNAKWLIHEGSKDDFAAHHGDGGGIVISEKFKSQGSLMYYSGIKKDYRVILNTSLQFLNSPGYPYKIQK